MEDWGPQEKGNPGRKISVWSVLQSGLGDREPRAGVPGTMIALMSAPHRKVQPPKPCDTE